MSKQILMLVGDYAEDYETMVPFQFLTGLGYTVTQSAPIKMKVKASPQPFMTLKASKPIVKNAVITLPSTTTLKRYTLRTMSV
jgi:putative intracellular protease/amidase